MKMKEFGPGGCIPGAPLDPPLVMLLHVCLSTGGSTWTGTPQDQVHPPGPDTPPRTWYTPGTRYTPPGPGTTLQDQVQLSPPRPGTPPGTRYTPPRPLLLQTVRILLECILVWDNFAKNCMKMKKIIGLGRRPLCPPPESATGKQ